MIVNIYIDNFLLAANSMQALDNLKKNLSKEYNIKNLGKVKIIIKWQIIRDLFTRTIRVSQLAYIKDLLKEKNLTNYNALTIPMKAGLFIKMNELDD